MNLEKVLIKQNKKLATPKELLQISEAEKLTSVDNVDVLSRVGMDSVIQKGSRTKSRLQRLNADIAGYNQERVFHISQIEKTCKKYHLRFLKPDIYKGTIDTELPNKISTFEVAYSVKCNQHNTRIMAPAKSFELEERPKDPLMFYQINSEYYYLIHKWGNDLSIFRRVLSFFSNEGTCWLTVFIIPCVVFFPMIWNAMTIESVVGRIALMFLIALGWAAITFPTIAETGSFVASNEDWDSRLKDKKQPIRDWGI
jgi:hypothetical protein